MRGLAIIGVLAGMSLTGGAAAAVAAPTNTGDERLAFVQEAYERLQGSAGFTSRTDQVYTTTTGAPGGRFGVIEFSYRAEITAEVLPRGDDMMAHVGFDLAFSSNTLPGPVSGNLELFKDGETLYGRINSFNPGPGKPPTAAGWVNLDLLADEASPAYAYLTEGTFRGLYGMNYPLESGIVSKVVELPAEDLDGQVMRVLRLEYTEQMLDAAGVMDDVVDMFNGQAKGDETADLTRQMLDGALFSLTVWIGVDDHLPHRLVDHIAIQSQMSVANLSFPVSGGMTLTTTLADFGRAPELTPPDVR